MLSLMSYCCRPTLIAKVAGPLLSCITLALLKSSCFQLQRSGLKRLGTENCPSMFSVIGV